MAFPFYQQLDKKDCGATCLRMIADYYGRKYSLRKLRDLSFISREGSSLMGISDAAEHIGFHALGLCTDTKHLKKDVTLPCILHWNQNHYVVCYKISRKNKNSIYYIADPAVMKRKFTEEELEQHWLSTRRNNENRGILLSLEVTPEFYKFDEETLKKPSGIGKYLDYLKPHKWAFCHNILCIFLFMIIGMVTPYLTQSLVDKGIWGGNLNFVLLILISQIILALTSMGINLINSWVTIHTNTRINLSIVSDFWSKLLKLPAHFFDTKVTGDIVQRFTDYGRIEDFLLNSSISIVFAIVNFLVYSFILFFYNLKVLFIFFVGYTIYVLWILCFLKLWKKLDYDNFEISSKNNKSLQLLQGIIDIKLNNEEKQKRWEWEKIQARMFRLSLKSLKIGQIQGNIGTLIITITNIVISYLVAKEVIIGQMTLGMMMAITYVTGQIAGQIHQFIDFIHSIQNMRISLERLEEINDMEDDETNIDNKRNELPTDLTMRFEHVSFSYDGSPRRYILKDLCFYIPQHKITAIVGNSGCGKTTIMKLLLGLYNPTNGNVKVGNISISQINPYLWRSKIGSVMQDGYLFSDTIARNIATGSLDIDNKRLYSSAQIANISDFINNQPLGYSTKIGMEGVGVSQGQKQRILIARAVYKNPDILLFDEATNALDSSNERIIMDNLNEYFKGKTVVISAHRLSTIKQADQIIAMKDGIIMEIGNHDELMTKKGEYYRLIENQL